jgi:hypothetical protein
MRDWLCKILCKSTDTVSVVERAYDDELQKRVIGLKQKSPLLKAAMDGLKNPLKLHKHNPSQWWRRQQNQQYIIEEQSKKSRKKIVK